MGVAMLWDTFWWNLPLYMESGCTSRCFALQWRHNGRDGVSNHQPHHCLLKRLFRRRSKKTSKLRVTGLCAGNSPVTGEFPTQMPVTWKMFPFDDVIMSLFRHDSPCLLLSPKEINLVFPIWWLKHYSDVIMSAMASNHRRFGCFSQPFVQAHIKENIKASRHWPLWGDFTGDRWIPLTKGQYRGKKFPCDDVIMSY